MAYAATPQQRDVASPVIGVTSHGCGLNVVNLGRPQESHPTKHNEFVGAIPCGCPDGNLLFQIWVNRHACEVYSFVDFSNASTMLSIFSLLNL